MKRVGNVFSEIYQRDNLQAAACAAAEGKRHRTEVIRFFQQLEQNLHQLSRQLQHGDYRFSDPRCFEAHDTKTRTIHAPVFVDRVVHHAIIRVVGPVLEKGAIAHSFACRRGRGQHAALRLARKYTRRTLCYGKLDFRRYYDSVDHSLLRLRLARRFQEPRVLMLFDQVLDSWQFSPGKGLPIGALTSQYLGNFFLDAFD